MSEARAIAPRVTVLPATRNRFTTAPIASVQKRRVAAYARVSTDSDEQLTSYEAQVDYYTHYIKERPDWTFAGMYADEGISGTNTKRRDGFNQMIADALAGKIDLIVTKSVSRFARNTVDSLTTVRKLKEKGVEVYFQKENIYTLDSKGELLITIMSSSCAGREPQHLGKRDVGTEKALRRWESLHALQKLPRLPQGREWRAGDRAGRSGSGAAHLPPVP